MVNTPGLGDGLKIEVEFTLAAPLDGTDAVMPDRHCYFGYGAEASEEFLLDSARRYWLCTKLWIPTEADAHPPEWVVWEEPPHANDPTTAAQPSECGGRLRPPAIANDLLVDGVAVCEQGSP